MAGWHQCDAADRSWRPNLELWENASWGTCTWLCSPACICLTQLLLVLLDRPSCHDWSHKETTPFWNSNQQAHFWNERVFFKWPSCKMSSASKCFAGAIHWKSWSNSGCRQTNLHSRFPHHPLVEAIKEVLRRCRKWKVVGMNQTSKDLIWNIQLCPRVTSHYFGCKAFKKHGGLHFHHH